MPSLIVGHEMPSLVANEIRKTWVTKSSRTWNTDFRRTRNTESGGTWNTKFIVVKEKTDISKTWNQMLIFSKLQPVHFFLNKRFVLSYRVIRNGWDFRDDCTEFIVRVIPKYKGNLFDSYGSDHLRFCTMLNVWGEKHILFYKIFVGTSPGSESKNS